MSLDWIRGILDRRLKAKVSPLPSNIRTIGICGLSSGISLGMIKSARNVGKALF